MKIDFIANRPARSATWSENVKFVGCVALALAILGAFFAALHL